MVFVKFDDSEVVQLLPAGVFSNGVSWFYLTFILCVGLLAFICVNFSGFNIESFTHSHSRLRFFSIYSTF